jgi:N-methylhydantoinase A
VMKSYIEKIEKRAASHGYHKPILVLQVTGGVVPSNEVVNTPLYTISSGPAAGVTGSSFLAAAMDSPNIIITDMGGTSFEAGIIYQGEPMIASETIVNQYVFSMPRLDVQSIGSGGGSALWFDESSGTLKVGPESAGADPGPACYGKGDTPTTTDANLILGYLNPDNFLGGSMPLDMQKSIDAIQPLAQAMGMSVKELAAGAIRIAESKMAELIRQMTLQRGLDPREFVIFSYGGAGPTHACEYARELGVSRIVIPLGTISAAWSAFGTLCADVMHVYEKSDHLSVPFDIQYINEVFTGLESKGRQQLQEDGVEADQIEIQRFVEVKYRMQIHQLSVPVPLGELDEQGLEQVFEKFEGIYEGFYGKGTAYREAGVEIGLFKINAIGRLVKPAIPNHNITDTKLQADIRGVYWPRLGEEIDTPVYTGQQLGPGHVIPGPAVVEFPETTIVVQPYATGSVDSAGNFIIDLEAGTS